MAAGTEVARLRAVLTASTGSFNAKMAGAASATERFADKVQGVGRRTQSFGASMTRNVSAPAAAAVGASVLAFANFDDKMAQSAAIMGDVSAEMRGQMEQTARTVAKETTVSAEEAAESFFFLASAGLDAQQSVDALPQVAKFAQAGMFDMATATDLATDAQSALGLKAQDAQKNLANLTRVTDVLVGANTLANASVQQFSEALTSKAGAAARNAGKDVEEVTAVLAALADQGIKGAEAGTQISRIYNRLPSIAKKNEEEWQKLGVSVFDASGEMRNSADIIGDLEAALGPMNKEQQTAALESLGIQLRMQQTVQALLGTSDAIRGYEKDLRSAAGTTGQVADKQLDSLTSQLTLAKDAVVDAAIRFGKEFAPVLKRVAQFVARAADALSNLPGPVIAVAAAVAGLLILAGPLITMLGFMITMGGVVAGAMTSIVLPVLAVVAAIGALVAAIIWAWNNSTRFRDTVMMVWEQIKVAISAALTFIRNLIQTTIALVLEFWNQWGADIMTTARKTWNQIVAIVRSAVDAFVAVVSWVVGVVQQFWERFGSHLIASAKRLWNNFTRMAGGVWEGIKNLIDGVLRVILGIWEVFAGIFTGDWSRVWGGIQKIVSGIWSAILGIIKGAWAMIEGVVRSGLEIISKIIGGGVAAISQIFSGAWHAIATTFDRLWDNLWNAASNGISDLGDLVGDIPGKILDWLGDMGSLLADAGRDLIGGFVDGITDKFDAVKDKLQGMTDK